MTTLLRLLSRRQFRHQTAAAAQLIIRIVVPAHYQSGKRSGARQHDRTKHRNGMAAAHSLILFYGVAYVQLPRPLSVD